MPQLKTKVGPLTLKNPVLVASGTGGYGGEETPLNLPLHKLGAFITKTITLNPRLGNPTPRIAETAGGMINAIGLENPGLALFCRDYLPRLRKIKTVRIVSIGGYDDAEFIAIAKTLNKQSGIDAIELNISCPNVKKGGICIAQDPEATRHTTRLVHRHSRYPLIVKLSPNVTDIRAIALAAKDGGADIVSLINTVAAMAINWRNRRPVLANVTGGLSGPAIKPIALKMVYETVQATKMPVIGIGGIMNAEDVVEFLVVGASAVEIGTLNLVSPGRVFRVIDGLNKLLADNRIKSVRSIIGSA